MLVTDNVHVRVLVRSNMKYIHINHGQIFAQNDTYDTFDMKQRSLCG